MVPTDLISLSEAERLSGFSRKTLYRWIKDGEITAYGRQGTLRLSLSDVFRPVDPAQLKLNPRNAHYWAAKRRSANKGMEEQGAQTPTCVKTDTVCLVNDSPVSDENTVQSSDKHAR